MSSLDVVVMTTEPVRIAETTGRAPGYGTANLGPVFDRLVPQVLNHLGTAGARPGVMIAWYEWPAEDGTIVLHAGFDIGDQEVRDGDSIDVIDLPSVKVASVLHRGPMNTIETTYEALVRWIEDRGHKLAGHSRELYLQWDAVHPERNVTQLQMPIET
jgi:effector-binding domain-containing protein